MIHVIVTQERGLLPVYSLIKSPEGLMPDVREMLGIFVFDKISKKSSIIFFSLPNLQKEIAMIQFGQSGSSALRIKIISETNLSESVSRYTGSVTSQDDTRAVDLKPFVEELKKLA